MVNRVLAAKVKKLKASRRKAYLNRPKHAGPAVGWLDWVHGRARELSNFEKWFWGVDHIPDDATRKSSDARRFELIADGKGVDVYDDDGNIIRVDKMPQRSPQSSREQVEQLRKKLEKALGVPMYRAISLETAPDGSRTMLAPVRDTEYYILCKRPNGVILRSIQYRSRELALYRFQIKKVIWEQYLNLDQVQL